MLEHSAALWKSSLLPNNSMSSMTWETHHNLSTSDLASLKFLIFVRLVPVLRHMLISSTPSTLMVSTYIAYTYIYVRGIYAADTHKMWGH